MMKKIITKITLVGVFLMCLLQTKCFALNTIAGDMLGKSRTMMREAENTEPEKNYLPIIIGVIVAIIVVIAIIIVVKNKKKKDTNLDKENKEV